MTGQTVSALVVQNARKSFGAIEALRDVSLHVAHGEVLALLGDNGAGKSTLLKCISGVHRLDGGAILVDGAVADIGSPASARQAGIETVHQDLGLFDNLTPSQNFFAGREIGFPAWLPKPLRFMNAGAMRREVAEVLDRLQVKLPGGDIPVARMSGGQRQAIAVARAAAFARRIVMLDEPTAALGLRESRKVLDLIDRLRQAGNAVVLVTHNMEHVIELADRAIVLRRGSKVGELRPTEQNRHELVAMIVGATA